jgi:hypothetical protein
MNQQEELLLKKNASLEKALAEKNRELEIESALERVRTVAMGMKKPDGLLHICEVLFIELKALGFSELRNALIHTFVDKQNYFFDYDYSDFTGGCISCIPYSGHPVIERFIKTMRKANDAFIEIEITGNELEEWKQFRKLNGEADDPRLDNIHALYYYNYSVGDGGIGISTYSSINAEKQEVLKRFRNVFDLGYRRYRDIQQAEVQARESQIQLALERVRARTMAMQHSDELAETASLLFKQISDLGIQTWTSGFNIWEKDHTSFIGYNPTPSGGITAPYHIPSTEDSFFINILEAKKRGEDFIVFESAGEALAKTYSYMKTLPVVRDVLNGIEDAGFQLPIFQINHCTFFVQGFLLFITLEPYPEAHDIFKRFGKVFEQTYTRFLDLQKAEAQTREAQIQLALERARAQSMMMQHSTELDDTLRVFHEQVLQLNIPSAFSFLWLPDEEKGRHIFWAAWAENNSTVFKSKAINYPLDRNEPATAQCLIDWKSNEPVVSYHVPPDGVENYFAAWSELIAGVEQLNPGYFRDGLYYIEAFMKFGCFGVMVANPLSEDEKKILDRFAIEFERTYTRFLDLQKAEAQAREAQIEAALEKVRSRTMGMQKSEELKEVIQVVYEQFIHLNILIEHTGFLIDYKARDDMHIWLADQHLAPSEVTIPYFDSPPNNSIK